MSDVTVATRERHNPFQNLKTQRQIIAGQLMLYPDLTINRVLWNGIRIPLTRLEFQLLVLLEPGSGKLFSSLFLQKEMGQYGSRCHIRFQVNRLRLRFRAVDPTFKQLITLRGSGYVWKP